MNADRSWLNRRVALVTGATSGIGRAVTEVLSRRGARVIAHGRSSGPVEEMAGDLGLEDQVVADLASRGGCEHVERSIERHAPAVLVLNAAAIGERTLVADISDRSIDELLQVNLAAPIRLARRFAKLPHLTGDEYRRLVLVLSTSCFYARPELSVYTATKMGLMGFGRVLQQEAHELRLRTTLLFPGRTNTGIRSDNHPEYTAPMSVGHAVASLLELPEDLVPVEFTFRPPVDTRI